MQTYILAVGKIKEKYLLEGIDEYLKRLGPYTKAVITEVKDEKIPDNASPAEQKKIRDQEATRLEKEIKHGTYLIALDMHGKAFSSPLFAAYLQELALAGKSNLTFLIGGSLGLSPRLIDKADLILSFSPMTFPHQLFRLLLLEQLYRAFKIIRGEPYHK